LMPLESFLDTMSLNWGGGFDRLEWAKAYTNVQDALAAAAFPVEIKLAKGIYCPEVGSGQTNNTLISTFVLTDGAELIGGFEVGYTDISDRDPQVNVTVQSSLTAN